MINKLIHKRKYRAYKDVFNLDDPSVRIVLKDMCQAHKVFNGGFDSDPYEHAFNSGERNAVLRIFTILKTDYESMIDLAEEKEE